MSPFPAEYRCTQCGHKFDRLAGSNEGQPHCPRCGSQLVEHNPYLFGTPSAEGLTPEDYFCTLLKH